MLQLVLGTALALVQPSPSPSPQLSPAQLRALLRDPSVVLINVHVPFQGAVPGTDAFIPFDRIVGDPRLPTDRNARIVLYCRSGTMSTVALRSLQGAGYRQVRELRGGMNAWTAAGYSLRGR